MRLCERFGCLPSQLYAEDAMFLGLVHLADLGRLDDPDAGNGFDPYEFDGGDEFLS